MPRLFFLHCAYLIVVAVSSASLCAQFQAPTSEELKMTSDPKAPGADAVYFDIEEIANDPIHYQSYYARIKVLTDKGKDLATVELPFVKGTWKVTGIEGRTIHPDGTIVALTAKPEDLLAEKTGGSEVGRRVFTLPSVEVGSILEYHYDIHYDDNHFSAPLWEIQRRYFVHKAHYSFTPFPSFMPNGTPFGSTGNYLVDSRGRKVNSLIWLNRLPLGVTMKTSVNGSYSVDVTDVPSIPDEAWMPPIDSFLYKVQFYYSFAGNAGDFWVGESKLWSKDVDKFAEPSRGIKEAVAGLVAPGDSDLMKAQKLYAAVQALDNTDYSRKKSATEMKALNIKEARNAQDTWQQKSGSSEDIAMLYLAMLRAAKLSAYAVKVVNRNQGIFDPTYLSLDQLDTTLVALTIDGNTKVLDPGEKMCPFGTLNWRHAGAMGLRQTDKGVAITTTPEPAYKENSVNRVADLNLDAHGGVTGYIQIIMEGQEALRWRQEALRYDGIELKKQFDQADLESTVPEGVEAHVDHFLGLDQPDQVLMAIVNVKGSLGVAMAKRVLLPGLFFETRAKVPFVNEEKRLESVDMHYPGRTIDDVTYHLPSGWTVEGAPQDVSLPWPGHGAFVLSSKAGTGQIEISNLLARGFTILKPQEYQDLRGFFQKVDTAEQAQVVLKMTPATAAAPVGTVAPAGKGN